MAPRTIAIIGGGITGLAIAEGIGWRAKDAGQPIRAIVLEAEKEAGGKIKSAREGGFVLDTGPHGFLDKEPAMFRLIDRLGLRGSIVRANPASEDRFVVRKGRLRRVPRSPPAFLTSDILPLGARLRVLLEPWAERRPEGADESVWSFAARRIGKTSADLLIDAMVTGIYGGDPKRLSLASAFPRMYELETKYGSLIKAQIALAKERSRALGDGARDGANGPNSGPAAGMPTGTLHSFREGLGELTRAIAERVEVRANFTARGIFKDGPGFRIEGSGDPFAADGVVLAVPAYEAALLLAPHAPVEAQQIGEIPYAPVAVVVQGYAQETLGRELHGFGFLCPFIEERQVLGVIWASSVFPEHVPPGTVMFRSMVGGVRGPALFDRDDATLLAAVRDELASLMGIDPRAHPIYERVVRWPRAIPQYDIGHAGRVAAADAIEARFPGLWLSGNAFRGVAMIACVAEAERLAARAVEHCLRL